MFAWAIFLFQSKRQQKNVRSLPWLTRVKFESYTEEDNYGDQPYIIFLACTYSFSLSV